jgi:5-methylcytosine-specific restriction endonuclease McrA
MTNPKHPEAPALRPRVTPLAPERFALQLTISQETHDKLRHAQALLGHALPSGDLAGVLDRALDTLIGELEKQKFAASARTRPSKRCSRENPRQVPAAIRRVVWQRDGGRCTFVSDKGHRCESRTRLEYDHVDPIARGGQTTAGNLRLRCRPHNQFEAERVFGAGFMEHKREEARYRRDQARESPRARGAAARPC